jgi:hypothetical protein
LNTLFKIVEVVAIIPIYTQYKIYYTVMNKYEIRNLLDPRRHILAVAGGIVGATLPNTYSNANPYIIGALVSGFLVKMIYGDYDQGYEWTFSDLVFWVVTLVEGIIGATIMTMLNVRQPAI